MLARLGMRLYATIFHFVSKGRFCLHSLLQAFCNSVYLHIIATYSFTDSTPSNHSIQTRLVLSYNIATHAYLEDHV